MLHSFMCFFFGFCGEIVLFVTSKKVIFSYSHKSSGIGVCTFGMQECRDRKEEILITKVLTLNEINI